MQLMPSPLPLQMMLRLKMPLYVKRSGARLHSLHMLLVKQLEGNRNQTRDVGDHFARSNLHWSAVLPHLRSARRDNACRQLCETPCVRTHQHWASVL